MPGDVELRVRRKKGRGGLIIGGLSLLAIAGSFIPNALAAQRVAETALSPALLTFGLVGCVVGALVFWMDATEPTSK